MDVNKKIIIIIVALLITGGVIWAVKKKKLPSNPFNGGSGGNNNGGETPEPDPEMVRNWGSVVFPIDYMEKGIEVLHVQALANIRGASLVLDGIFGPNTRSAYKEHILQLPDWAEQGVKKIYEYDYNNSVKPRLDEINKHLIKLGKL